MSESPWQVGTEVIVTGHYVRGTQRTKVGKVGRKYFYLEGSDTPFQLTDGRQKSDGYGYQYKSQVWLPADYEADQVRQGVLKQLGEHGLRWSFDS